MCVSCELKKLIIKGSGVSSLHAFFLENGPFLIDQTTMALSTDPNPYSWHNLANVIYMDAPAGAGFSFSDNIDNFATNETTISNELYSAVDQFFTLFPDMQGRDLFLSGQGTSAHLAFSLGHQIHINNVQSNTSRINLNGIMVGNGWWDPRHQMVHSELYYNLGLIDNVQKNTVGLQEYKTRKNMKWQNFDKVLQAFTIQMGLVKQYSGISNSSIIYDYRIMNYINVTDFKGDTIVANFLASGDWKTSLHVGTAPYGKTDAALARMPNVIFSSVADKVYTLLQNNYKILFYSGQLDLLIPYTGTRNALANLYFRDWYTFQYTAKTLKWQVDNNLAGYVKKGEFFKFLLVNENSYKL